MARTKTNGPNASTANLGFEADLVDCMAALAESTKLEAAIRANLKSLNFNP